MSQQPNSKSNKILVLDDEPDFRDLISSALSRDYEIKTVETIEAARSALQESLPGLFISDARLPDGNGLDLCKEMRAAHPELKIILSTGHGGEELAEEAIAAGVNDVLLKPYSLAALRTLVSQYLN